MEEIEATCPPDDRTALRRVFSGAGRQTIGNAMRNACKTAGIANYSPHDLRHRFISVKMRGNPGDRDRGSRRPQPQVADT
jgi:integrase